MREIKFRAWENKKMEYYSGHSLEDCFVGYPYKDYLYMQFTGLLDKNGKEIYEGDILLYRKVISKISFQDKNTGNYVTKEKKNPREELHYYEVFFSPKGQWCMRRNDQASSLFGQNERHEIIGNIHSNPELLK